MQLNDRLFVASFDFVVCQKFGEKSNEGKYEEQNEQIMNR